MLTRDALAWYLPIGYRFISQIRLIYISIAVADITNSVFCLHIFNLWSCGGNFLMSLPQYENVQDKIAHSIWVI